MAESKKGLQALSFKERIVLAQNELKAPKGQFNSFGKYKYRSQEDILEGVKPINLKFGLQLYLKDEPVMVGNRIYIKATATLEDVHGDHYIEVTGFARESETKKGMDDSQITGTASSYARKYALNGLYLIDDTKDADTDEHRKQVTKAPVKKATNEPKELSSVEEQAMQILNDLQDAGHNRTEIQKNYLTETGEPNFKDMAKFLGYLKEKASKQEGLNLTYPDAKKK